MSSERHSALQQSECYELGRSVSFVSGLSAFTRQTNQHCSPARLGFGPAAARSCVNTPGVIDSGVEWASGGFKPLQRRAFTHSSGAAWRLGAPLLTCTRASLLAIDRHRVGRWRAGDAYVWNSVLTACLAGRYESRIGDCSFLSLGLRGASNQHHPSCRDNENN